MEEMTYAFTDIGMEVADRKNLPYVRRQLQLQTEGEVSDKDGQSIGKFVGAKFIVTGQFIPTGGQYRFRATAINVEKATRTGGARFDVTEDSKLQNTLTALKGGKVVSRPNQGTAQTTRPKTAGKWLDEGIALASQGKFNDAVNAFTQALALDSGLSAAYYNRGEALYDSVSDIFYINNRQKYRDKVYSAQERTVIDRAIADYDQAIRLDPDYTVAYIQRGTAYKGKGDNDRAIADYTQAIRLDPNDADAYNNRGVAYINKGDNDRAIADCTQAIRLNPNDAAAYNNRGYAYYDKDDYNRAIADYNQAIRLDPNYTVAYYNRGNAYNFGKDDNDRAIADYTQAIRLDPNNADAYNNRGVAYEFKGDYDRAIADYTQAIRLDPNDANYYRNRGDAYYGKGDYNRAIADYEVALRINPNHAGAKKGLENARKRK
jgi:tetratricopeptide (TPR) repeat protein